MYKDVDSFPRTEATSDDDGASFKRASVGGMAKD